MLRALLCVTGIVAIGFNANAVERISPTEYYELWRQGKGPLSGGEVWGSGPTLSEAQYLQTPRTATCLTASHRASIDHRTPPRQSSQP